MVISCIYKEECVSVCLFVVHIVAYLLKARPQKELLPANGSETTLVSTQ
jgi:hypothetical protein